MTVHSLREARDALRRDQAHEQCHREAPRWSPAGHVLAVAGATGNVGATTVALAIAEAAHDARLVETCRMDATGLAVATSAELGMTADGWRRGTRGEVLVERTTIDSLEPTAVPPPAECSRDLTVVDVGWNLAHVMAKPSWIQDLVTLVPLVLVAPATIPGIRALEVAVRSCGRTDTNVVAALIGPSRHRWPAGVSRALSVRTAAALGDRIVTVPALRELAINGIDARRLPVALVDAMKPVVAALGASTPRQGSPTNTKGEAS